jgi:hypothetical protein
LGWYCARFILEIYNFEFPKKIFSSAKYLDNDKNKTITHMISILWFENDRMATLECSYDDCVRQKVDLIGRKGLLSMDDWVLPKNDQIYSIQLNNEQEPKKIKVEMGMSQEAKLIENFSNGIDESWGKKTFLTQKLLDEIEISSNNLF